MQLDDRVIGFVDGSAPRHRAHPGADGAAEAAVDQGYPRRGRVSALLVNELWSHDDEECKTRMAASLEKSDGGYPAHAPPRTVLAERAAKLALEAEGSAPTAAGPTATTSRRRACQRPAGGAGRAHARPRADRGLGRLRRLRGEPARHRRGVLAVPRGHQAAGHAQRAHRREPLPVKDVDPVLRQTLNSRRRPPPTRTSSSCTSRAPPSSAATCRCPSPLSSRRTTPALRLSADRARA